MSDRISFDQARFEALLDSLEQMVRGEERATLPISGARDALDALAFGVNVLEDERSYATGQLRVAKEEAERANRAKTVFLRNVSHEIRTPLTAILGLSAMLAEAGLGADERRDLVARIQRNGTALLGLVQDVLDLSKIEAGRLELEHAATSPAELCRDVLKSLEAETRAKGLRVGLTVAPGVPEWITTDPARLRQILLNVIGNAVKFTDIGEIKVALALDGDRLQVDVRDTGIGIGAQERSRLFVAFGQGGQAAEQRYGGTGLGLMLAKRLAQALGGDVTLSDSTAGAGATFRVQIAAPVVAAQSLAGEGEGGRDRPTLALSGLRLLLVEDNADIRFAIARILELAGARVELATDGSEALEHAQGNRFDLILMDVRMPGPGPDGLEATRRLRLLGDRTPVIALTADALAEHRAECLAAGCNDYLSKPFDHQKLIDKIRALARTGLGGA